jgi:PAS domain S-box-containing protein
VVNAYSEAVPSVVHAKNAIRNRLQEKSRNIEVFHDALDLVRIPGRAHQDRMARFLADKYAEKRPDVIVALSSEALRYLLQYRETIAPGVPLVLCCMTLPGASAAVASPGVTGVTSDRDWSRTLALATRLQPNARDIVFISGATDDDRMRLEEAVRDIGPQLKSYDVRHLVGLPHDALLKEVASLPRETIVLLSPIFKEGGGRTLMPREAAAAVAKASNAPVYAPYDLFMGQGIVGGYMASIEDAGMAAADLVMEIVGGKGAKNIPPPVKVAQHFRVDARQLARWGLSESSLPDQTEVLYRQPTLWEQHRTLALATIAAFGLLTTILVALSVQMVRRRRAEASLKESEERMAFAAASSNTGLWQYDVVSRQLWSTDHCRSMFGLQSGPLTPARLLRAAHPHDRQLVAAGIRSVMRGGPAIGRREFRVVDRDGKMRWLLASTHSHLGEDGTPIKVTGVFRDVTERRWAEDEARQLSQRLLTVQDEERRRIALELHDSTMQHLAAVSLNMMNLKARAAFDGKASKLYKDIEASLEEASRELRTFTYLLHPPELETDGLRSTMHRFVEGFAARTGLEVSLSISPRADEFPSDVQRSLLRVVQEALANVRRHASATHAAVTLGCGAGQIDLVVSDDGSGFKPLPTQARCGRPTAGVGIPGMTARLRQLGGELKIHSDATGTTLHGIIPSR